MLDIEAEYEFMHEVTCSLDSINDKLAQILAVLQQMQRPVAFVTGVPVVYSNIQPVQPAQYFTVQLGGEDDSEQQGTSILNDAVDAAHVHQLIQDNVARSFGVDSINKLLKY
jgi:hypothetical protein